MAASSIVASASRSLVASARPRRARAMAPLAASAAAAASTAAPPSPSPSSFATTATAIPTISCPADAHAALRDIDTILFDQDGVLWRGDEDVPGAARALQSLAASSSSQGGGSSSADEQTNNKRRRVYFATNNSTLSRRRYAAKLTKRLGGLEVKPEQVICAAWSAAEYLRAQGFGSENGRRCGDKVLALGEEEGLLEELREAGIEYVRGPMMLETTTTSTTTETTTATAATTTTTTNVLRLASLRCTPNDIASFELDPSIGAVVIGWSAEQFSYTWIAYAAACLRELPHCDHFVVTNRDAADRLPSGRFLPGTGALVAAIEAAAGKEHVAVDTGKGGEWLLKGLLPRAIPNFDPARTCMVGDRLDTDCAFAVAGEFRATMLTLTGVANREEAEAAEAGQRPTHILPSVADLTLEEEEEQL